MPGWGALLVEFVLIGVVLLLLYAVLALFYIYFERKVCAFFQCRLGPNRVGPYGIIQSVADMFKILIKELISLNHIDKFLFNLAPYLVIVASMLAFGCLPFGRGLQVIDFNIGVFFLIAVSSIGVLGILLAGWSSHNKFTLIGSLNERTGYTFMYFDVSAATLRFVKDVEGVTIAGEYELFNVRKYTGTGSEVFDKWFADMR